MSILPPATIGIFGGGQLGRMTSLAARSLGFNIRVLDPGADCAAAPVVDRVVRAAFDDEAAAAEFANGCDVVTLEIEQISPGALAAALQHAPVRPSPEAIHIIQDRQRQKEWLSQKGAPVGPYAVVQSAEELALAWRTIGPQLFVKACHGGYDGRSQFRYDGSVSAQDAFASIGGLRSVAEQALPLALELSVLVARRPSGDIAVYPPALNHHEQQILAWSVLPGEIDPRIASEAQRIASDIARELRLEGILAVEMFLLTDGRLFVNELAPRPHNSYHASELACVTSQFEQHVRAVCDLPLGDTRIVRPAAIVNLFGDLWLDGRVPDFARALSVNGSRLFLYGKHGARAARKMGHLAASADTPALAIETALHARSLL